jgi:long-chain acyl-CoA synthetase
MTNGLRFGHFAEKNPEALAIVDPSGQLWTRGQIAARMNALSRALGAHGVAPGEVMAITAPNCAEYLIAYLAAMQAGLHVLPINWHLAPSEIRYILEDSKAGVIVGHKVLDGKLTSVLSKMEVIPRVRIALCGGIATFSELDDIIQGFDSSPISGALQGRVLSYTSATTGKPKGVKLPLEEADRVLDLGIQTRIVGGTLPEADVQLCYSMLYHGAPLGSASVGLHMGHIVVLAQHFAPEHLLQLIDHHKVTLAYIVPTMFARLLKLDESVRQRYSIRSLQKVIHTGAPCPMDVKRRMIDWWGPVFVELYGATEGSGTIVNSLDWLRYPGTVGKALPGTRLMIVGEDGEEVATGVQGNVYLTRYTGDRFEYLGDPEKTLFCHRGDYFTVGDVGYVNDEGFLFLCDRKIDMVNLSGMKVYPAEIESALVQHPDVADCAVFGVPDPDLGEAIMVVIQPTRLEIPAHELKTVLVKFLSEHISPYKYPKYFEFVSELGRDVTGKLQKRRLRERFVSQLGRD